MSKAQENAVQCFEDGIYRIFLDEEPLENLDDGIFITEVDIFQVQKYPKALYGHAFPAKALFAKTIGTGVWMRKNWIISKTNGILIVVSA